MRQQMHLGHGPFRVGVPSALALATVAVYAQGTSSRSINDPLHHTRRVRLPGDQLISDSRFDFLDWNGDGKLDIFLADPGMISGYVHLNEGSTAHPQFGHALYLSGEPDGGRTLRYVFPPDPCLLRSQSRRAYGICCSTMGSSAWTTTPARRTDPITGICRCRRRISRAARG